MLSRHSQGSCTYHPRQIICWHRLFIALALSKLVSSWEHFVFSVCAVAYAAVRRPFSCVLDANHKHYLPNDSLAGTLLALEPGFFAWNFWSEHNQQHSLTKYVVDG